MHRQLTRSWLVDARITLSCLSEWSLRADARSIRAATPGVIVVTEATECRAAARVTAGLASVAGALRPEGQDVSRQTVDGEDAASSASAVGSRHVWMDVMRGAAVLLVVLFHVLIQADRLGLPDPPRALAVFSRLASPLRLPAMVFLSGLLLPMSLRKGPRRFLEGKLRRIAWPYVVWSAVTLGCWQLLRPVLPTGHDPVEMLSIAWAPVGILWFLHHLFVYYVALLALQRVPLLVPLAATVAATTMVSNNDLERFFFYFAVFVLGAMVAQHLGTFERLLHDRWAVALSVLLTAALVVATLQGVHVRHQVAWLPLVGAAVVVMAAVGALVGDHGGGARVRVGGTALAGRLRRPLAAGGGGPGGPGRAAGSHERARGAGAVRDGAERGAGVRCRLGERPRAGSCVALRLGWTSRLGCGGPGRRGAPRTTPRTTPRRRPDATGGATDATDGAVVVADHRRRAPWKRRPTRDPRP